MKDESARWWVVVNDEEQYSIWAADREVPAGWRTVGSERSKEECLAYIEEVWTDMRPKSLREKLSQRASAVASSTATASID